MRIFATAASIAVLALGLTGYQWACLALIPVFVALWARDAQASLRGKAGVAARVG